MKKIAQSILKNNLEAYFSIFSNCIMVKGESRGVIYDLQRESIHFLPNIFIELLTNYKANKILDLAKGYSEQIDILEKYFSYLFENELLCFTQELDNFPKISEQLYLIPDEVDFLSLEIDSLNKDKINILNDIDYLGIKELLIIQTKKLDTNFLKLKRALTACDESRIQNIIFICPYTNPNESKIHDLKEKYPRLSTIIFFDSNEDVKTELFIKTKQKLFNVLCRRIDKVEDFVVNIKAYVEAKNFNLFFNRKVYIKNNGDIKHSYDDSNSYGNIKKDSLKKTINSSLFQELWNVKKENIAVYSSCEFRFICPDNRIPVFNEGENIFKHLIECNYDPKSNKWK